MFWTSAILKMAASFKHGARQQDDLQIWMHANKYEDNIHCADLEQILFIIHWAQPAGDLMEGGTEGIYIFCSGDFFRICIVFMYFFTEAYKNGRPHF